MLLEFSGEWKKFCTFPSFLSFSDLKILLFCWLIGYKDVPEWFLADGDLSPPLSPLATYWPKSQNVAISATL